MSKPLSKSLKRFYGIGDLGFGLMTNVGMFFQAYFLTDIAKFDLALAATIITIPNVFDAIFSGVYGAIIDSIRPMRWGKYRSWLLVTPPFVVLFMTLQYTKIGPELVAAAIIIASAIISKPLLNIPWVANLALINVLSSNQQEKVLLSSRRGFWSSLSRLFFSYIATPIAIFFGGLAGSQIFGYTMLQFLMAVCMMLGFLIIFRMTEGYEELPDRNADVHRRKAGSKKKEKSSFCQILKNLFQNPPLLWLLLADFGRMMSSFIISATIAYYYTYVAGNMSLMPFHMFITSVGGIIGNLIAPKINKKFNSRIMTVASSIISGGFFIVAKFVGLQPYLFMAASTLAGIANGVLFSTIVALYSDTIVYGEWKTGKNASGFIMGLMNVPLKVAKMSNGIVLTSALASIGFVAGITPTAALKTGIINISTLIPAASLILCGLLILFGFRLTEDKIEQMQREINARKQEITA